MNKRSLFVRMIRKMHCIESIIFLMLMLFCFFNCYAQSVELPKIIPPSPESSLMERYGTYPVGHYTGVPYINIPLYEIESGQIKVPISLSYHASGFRPEDDNGPIGFGWTLNAGGRISRTVMGAPDDMTSFPNPHKHSQDWDPVNDYQELKNIADLENYVDSEYDVFSFRIDEDNGGFYLKDSSGIKSPIAHPYRPLKISYTRVDNNQRFKSIKIINELGVEYHFGRSLIDDSDVTEWNNVMTSSTSVSSWLLTEIISADKSDTVSFHYIPITGIHGTMLSKVTKNHRIELKENFEGRNPDFNYGSFPPSFYAPYETWADVEPIKYYYENLYTTYTTFLLSEIRFKGGKVVFSPSNDKRSINSIQVLRQTENQDVLLKSFELDRTSFLQNESHFLKLNKIRLKGEDGSITNEYSFDYHNSVGNTLSENVREWTDWWGFYNGRFSAGIIPLTQIPNVIPAIGEPRTAEIGNISANLDPNEDAMKTFMLKRIEYPTGGFSEFTYEANKYYDSKIDEVKLGGGLRIKEIRDVNNFGESAIRTYKYGLNESGIGETQIKPSTNDYTSESIRFRENEHYQGSYERTSFYSRILPELQQVQGSPVVYEHVSEYYGRELNKIGKTDYKYSYQQLPLTIMEAQGQGVFRYSRFQVATNDQWKTGKIVSKTDFKYEYNKYAPVYKKEYEYEVFHKDALISTKVSRGVLYNNTEEIGLMFQRHPFLFSDYIYNVGDVRLDKVTDITYSDETELKKIEEFEYDSYNQRNRILTTESNGRSRAEEYKYPYNFAHMQPYIGMVDKNIINIPIEVKKEVGGSITEIITNNYFNPNTNVYALNTVEHKVGSMDPEIRLRYNDYDENGNLLSVSKEFGPSVCYVWGYGGNYPVAKIENATYQAVIDALGGLSNISVFRNILNPSDAYVNSFLEPLRLSNELKNAMITTYTYKPLKGISSAKDPKGQVFHYEYGPDLKLKSILDKDRSIIKQFFYNYSSQSNTLGVFKNSYKSSIFFKDNCAPGYSPVEFIYSVPAGLYTSNVSQLEADQLATNDISVNGQSLANKYGVCKLTYYNASISMDFTRNNCIPANTGGTVTYTVPYGKYVSTISQADADKKAQVDIELNGQNYANLNGSCDFFYNTEVSREFTRNNCPTNNIGSKVLFVVEAGKYSSQISQADADSKAMNDININGQSFANLNGTCEEGITLNLNNSTSSGFDLTLIKGSTYTTYVIPPGTSTILVPIGVYSEVWISDSSNTVYNFTVGYQSMSGTTAVFNDVTFTTFTNNISISY